MNDSRIRQAAQNLAMTAWAVGLALAVFIGLSAPATGQEGSPEEIKQQRAEASSNPQARSLLLRGNPGFDADELSDEARRWYDRFWIAIEQRDRGHKMKMAASNDLYLYGRTLNNYHNTLLFAFRATGDLRILDEIDKTAQEMRSQLKDGWVDGTTDGYLNWVWMAKDASDPARGRDTHVMNEMLTHAGVAQFAYAFHANRDLKSPGGVDYAERAEFWLRYLEDHFEAKWRERRRCEWPRMDFLTRGLTHPHLQFVRYHYYMAGMTGKQEYAQYAREVTDEMFETQRTQDVVGGFAAVPTPFGEGVIWSHRAPGAEAGDPADGAQPFTYIENAIAAAVDLAAEGFHRWDADLVHKIGVSLAHFVMDTDPIADVARPFAGNISGGFTLSGDGWILPGGLGGRGTASSYASSPYAFVVPFMKTDAAYDRVVDITLQAYRQHSLAPHWPRSAAVPAVMLVDAIVRGP